MGRIMRHLSNDQTNALLLALPKRLMLAMKASRKFTSVEKEDFKAFNDGALKMGVFSTLLEKNITRQSPVAKQGKDYGFLHEFLNSDCDDLNHLLTLLIDRDFKPTTQPELDDFDAFVASEAYQGYTPGDRYEIFRHLELFDELATCFHADSTFFKGYDETELACSAQLTRSRSLFSIWRATKGIAQKLEFHRNNFDNMVKIIPIISDGKLRHEKSGCPIFMQAISQGFLRLAETMLIQTPDLVHHKDKENNTPLMICDTDEHLNMASLLILHKIDINAINQYRETALIKAVGASSLPVVTLFLKHGANVNVQDNGGRTALMNAVRSDHDLAITSILLLAKDIDIDLTDTVGDTAYTLAIGSAKHLIDTYRQSRTNTSASSASTGNMSMSSSPKVRGGLPTEQNTQPIEIGGQPPDKQEKDSCTIT